MENVEEIQSWGPLLPDGRPDKAHAGRTWKAFLAALGSGIAPNHPDLDEILEVLGDTVTREELIRGFGYAVEVKELRACDYGSPTIRKRLFLIARCDGRPIVWPAPTHTKKPSNNRLKSWRAISECIDWSIPCNSIFLTSEEAKAYRCKRPLAKSTLKRIATGIDRYVMKSAKPFVVCLTHQGTDRVEGIDEPTPTVTGAKRGERALVTPIITEHANGSTQRNFSAQEPLRTQCAEIKGGHFALVAGSLVRTAHGEADKKGRKRGRGAHALDEASPAILASGDLALAGAYLAQHNGGFNTTPGHEAADPISTISGKGSQQQVVAAYLAQNNFDRVGKEATEPVTTITAKGHQQTIVAANLAAYYGTAKDGQACDSPSRTTTTKPRFCLVESQAVKPMTPDQVSMARRVAAFLREHGVQFEGEFATVQGFVIVDIGMRMLTARELFRAQGFPDTYTIDRAWVVNPHTGDIQQIELTKEQQIRMCGNSVCPQVAAALVAANSPDMAVWGKNERKRLVKT